MPRLAAKALGRLLDEPPRTPELFGESFTARPAVPAPWADRAEEMGPAPSDGLSS